MQALPRSPLRSQTRPLASRPALPAAALLGLLPILWLGGCASRAPIVDQKGVDQAAYQRDLAECQGYADQVAVGKQAGAGALGGAAVGAALGAILGNSDTVERAAGSGAVVGGARGAVAGTRERSQVVKNCLRGRGYRVLN